MTYNKLFNSLSYLNYPANTFCPFIYFVKHIFYLFLLEDCNQNETIALQQSYADAVYQESCIFDSFSKLKDIYDYQSSKYAVNGESYISGNNDTTDAVIMDNDENKNTSSTATTVTLKTTTTETNTDVPFDSNGDLNLNDGGFTRAKILYDKVKDKMPDR